jgi:hypothetical protein
MVPVDLGLAGLCIICINRVQIIEVLLYTQLAQHEPFHCLLVITGVSPAIMNYCYACGGVCKSV